MQASTSIINYDEFCTSTDSPHIVPHIRSPFRMVISSKSSGGKTNLLLNLVINPLVYYDKLIVFSTTLYQKKYKFMQDFFEEIYQDKLKAREKTSGTHLTVKKMINKKVINSDIESYATTHDNAEPIERIATFYDEMDALPSVSDITDDLYTLIVVDDCILEKNQKKIIEYFVKGRQKKISVIYQTQKFTALPSILREQASHYIFMGKQNNVLYNTISMSVPIGLDYKSIKKLFNECIRDTFDFVLIDTTCADPERIIYRNIDEPMHIDNVRVE